MTGRKWPKQKGPMKCLSNIKMLTLLAMLLGQSLGQDASRVKIAQGEYMLSTDGDLGVGPVDTEIFGFHELWTLWRSADGNYEIDGERDFESPRGTPHRDTFLGSAHKGPAACQGQRICAASMDTRFRPADL